MKNSAFFPIILTTTAAVFTARADVTLSPIIGSNMVLQRDAACPVWGWAEAGEEVTVEFAGQRQTAKPGADGKWTVKLAAMKANATGQTMTIRGKNTLTLDNILIGDVWLCSGQSNMEWTVAASGNPKEEIAAGEHPLIRHIKVGNPGATKPEEKVMSKGWEAASPATVANFTAVGYYFARELRKSENVPVGLLGANWGGTRIEPWTPPQGFKAVESYKEITAKLSEFPQTQEKPDKADPTKKIVSVNIQTPLALYNGRIAPLVPFAIKGALWYQGESNLADGAVYTDKMQALISGWRDVWQKPELPFYFVQLAPFIYRGANPESLPRIWEAQSAALKIPNTGMAVLTDIGDINDIHPKNKQEVGRRLALIALAKTYGKRDIIFSGPVFKSVKFNGSKATLTFDNAAGLKSRDGKPLSHFTVSGSGKTFVPAQAEISGSAVVVSAADIPKIEAVRLGWSHDAEPNLSNGAGLPAAPFRTDDWPIGPMPAKPTVPK